MIAGVLGGLLLLSAAAGFGAADQSYRIVALLMAAPLALFAAILTLRRFDLVVLALPAAALALPVAIPTGTGTELPIVWAMVLLFVGLWGFTMLVRRRFHVAPSILNGPMLAFAVVCIISLVWGTIWRDPVLIRSNNFILVQIVSLLTHLLSLGAALLIGNFVRSERRLKLIVGLFLFFGALMTITQYRSISQSVLNDRGLWGTWTVVPAFALMVAQPKLGWRWRLALAALIAANLYVSMILNAYWLSGWVPTIAGIYAVTLLRSKRAFLVLLLVGAIVFSVNRSWIDEVAQSNVADGSLQRLGLWEQNWRVVRSHWLFGTGPAGYALYYMTYYREDARSTHNNYLDILGQFGFAGMAAWIWLAAAGLFEGWRLTRRAPPGFLRTLAIMATAGWAAAQVSMFFGDWVLPFAYNQTNGGFSYTVYTWLFFGTLISIRQLLSARDAREAAAVPAGGAHDQSIGAAG